MNQTPQAPPQDLPRLAARSPAAVALFLGVTLLVLAADLGLKYWTFHTPAVAGHPVLLNPDDPANPLIPQPYDPVTLVPGILHLELVVNTGAVFGLGAGYRWVFIAVSLVAIVVVGYIFLRSPARSWLSHLGLALILAGALGNLYDRIRYSAVRDMLRLFPDTHLWPWVFNLADVALVVGVGLIILITARREMQQRRAGQSDPR